MRAKQLGLVVSLGLTSCGGGSDPSDASFHEDAPSATDDGGSHEGQTPPQGRAAMGAWLAAASYKNWKCEPTVMNARPNGAHGRNRICANDLMSSHGGGPFPVGAAAVKELYGSGNEIIGHAVSRKVTSGTGGDAWYWYELTGTSVHADGVGVRLCTGCHTLAAERGGNDFVYVQVK